VLLRRIGEMGEMGDLADWSPPLFLKGLLGIVPSDLVCSPSVSTIWQGEWNFAMPKK